MDSPDRNSQSSAGDIQGSPLFNFLCSLSPIKPVKSARVAQTYSEISFPPPPAVFVSPGVNAQKASSSFERHQSASRGEEAQAASEIGPTAAHKEVKHVLVNSTQRVQRLRSVRRVPKTQSFSSPCSSPSKLVEEYLADPAENELDTEEDKQELVPSSGDCQIRASRCDASYDHALQLSKQEDVLNKESSTQNAQGCNAFDDSLSTRIAHQSEAHNTDILDFHHQETADLEFLMSEDVDDSSQEPCIDSWRTVTSSSLSELSAEQVEGYIASLRGIVNEDEETGVLPTHVVTEVVADSNVPANNLETESGPKGSQGVGACKTIAPHQRGVRRRCLDFEVSEGLVHSETRMLSARSLPTNLDKRQDISSCGAEANRALLVLKKRVSATLGAMSSDTMQRLNVTTENSSKKEGTASIKMTCAATVNIKVSRCSPLVDIDSHHSCAKTSPAGMPSGIGLHLNSLASSMPCIQIRETDVTASSVSSIRHGNTLAGGMISSKMQGSPVESAQRSLLPLNPGKHMYAGTSAESRQGLVDLPLQTRLDDFEVQSECSDQDIESSKSAICVHSASLATRQQVQDIAPLAVLNKRPSPIGRKRVLLQDRAYQGEVEGAAEDSIQSPYSPKKKRRTSSTAEKSGDSCKRCNCKKSKCLKLYCECFAAGVYCVDSCTCQGCFNKPEFEDTVMDTRQQIESRNPLAFAPKIIRTIESSPTKRDESRDTPASARHKRGCNCKKSHCLKKYCECFQAGVGCSDGCRCENCKNVHGRKEGAQDFDDNDLQMEAALGKELAEEYNSKAEYCAEFIHGSRHQNLELSPTTPAFQHGGQHRPVIKTSLTVKKRTSLEALRSPGASLPKAGNSPATTPRIMRIGRFSPRWDGLDEICTLTPGLQAPLRPTPASASVLDRAELSPSGDEQICNELTITNKARQQSSKFSSLTSPLSHQQSSQCLTPAHMQDTPQTRTPYSAVCGVDNKPLCEDSKAYGPQVMEDDGTPEFLKDPEPDYLPVCLLNSSSPKHKRVSPPHHHAMREASHRGLQSPGLRSSRKFILQSIPALPPTPFASAHEKPNGNKSHT
ncbi:hypothetical protein GOP47_0024443 [Adiantum capillus-veneris]|uniref:CRC domain-containing protein n=1 Tax=Adiantum capillus-veneris TaxID=13818 RepID=A0A9D4Z2R8_ADICA|nr:hypothetical protein GOP47_0024443 [Adiantum capillus-veneris]